MWRPAFEVFAPSPVRGSPTPSETSPVRRPLTVHSTLVSNDNGGSPLQAAIAKERLQSLLDLARVSEEGLSTALSRVENERDAGHQKLSAAAALIERQRSELERNCVMVQANQQRTEALRQALQLAEQQATVRRSAPQLEQAAAAAVARRAQGLGFRPRLNPSPSNTPLSPSVSQARDAPTLAFAPAPTLPLPLTPTLHANL